MYELKINNEHLFTLLLVLTLSLSWSRTKLWTEIKQIKE